MKASLLSGFLLAMATTAQARTVELKKVKALRFYVESNSGFPIPAIQYCALVSC